MPLVNIVVGLALLFAGRRLFWLFVAAVGFVAGLDLATPIAETEPTATALLIALFAGAIGAALALLLQPLAVAVAGFAAGALLVESLGVPHAGEGLLLILVGGLVGATCGHGSAGRARAARRRIRHAPRRRSPGAGTNHTALCGRLTLGRSCHHLASWCCSVRPFENSPRRAPQNKEWVTE